MSEHPHEFLSVAVARQLAFDRQGGYCARCHKTMSVDAFDAHHRRRRQLLGWCACNIVALHPSCHTGAHSVHDQPTLATNLGLIVPARERREPCEVPIMLVWPWHAPTLLGCDGLAYSMQSSELVIP